MLNIIIVTSHQKGKNKNQLKEKVLSVEEIVQDKNKEIQIAKIMEINVKDRKINRVKINPNWPIKIN